MQRTVASTRFWLLQSALAITWVAVWHLGRLLEQTQHASLWFPGAALTFALYVSLGAWATAPVMTGAVIATFHSAALHGDSRSAVAVLLSGIGFGIAHCLVYGAAAWLFERLHARRDRLGTPTSVLLFLLVTTVASLAAAATGLASLELTGTPVPGGFDAHLVSWWLGDLVALVTLVPFFVVVVDLSGRALQHRSSVWTEHLTRLGPESGAAARFVTKLVLSGVVVAVLGALAARSELGVPNALVAYAMIVPLMWIAHTEGGVRTVVAVAVLATVVALVTRFFGLIEHVFDYQAAMITIAGVGLFNLTVPRLFADNERLRHLVTFDRLTGARTRAVFLDSAEEILSRRGGGDSPVSLVFFDLDSFKAVNDELGHAAGDSVLQGVGDICRQEVRSLDLFGRLGGEEFAILLPRTTKSAAASLAERLRAALEAADEDPSTGTRPVTASFGVVEVRPGESFHDALDRADTALYRAKSEGRNRISVG